MCVYVCIYVYMYYVHVHISGYVTCSEFYCRPIAASDAFVQKKHCSKFRASFS